MNIKITENLICIPPYISTHWDQVSLIRTEEDVETKKPILILHLHNGFVVQIPNLASGVIDIAFLEHLQHLNQASKMLPQTKEAPLSKTIGVLLQQMLSNFGNDFSGNSSKTIIPNIEGLEGIEMILQHNSAQNNHPLLDQDSLEKMIGIVHVVTNGNLKLFPNPEPHCTCIHCQTSRSIHSEEDVKDEELNFSSWEIAQTGDNLFTVINPLDPNEQYNVFLGDPIGCTCGQKDCEHIKAVLYS
ncbi:Uncharacterized protein CLAVI_000860 [Candidatus Clavichlamydia salmonicola]|uniref:hypothetical protein n=1 Tax=Candidatus Clavichlamydia salmonicola TaxID=469812 RepID=UPI001890F531|nr:hypothetical protein [Candidatus Clavichlamydia salmonicola]MBF5051219.1 Uncharacterized protein [Candidatus Clavichlamydia salmonicola]